MVVIVFKTPTLFHIFFIVGNSGSSLLPGGNIDGSGKHNVYYVCNYLEYTLL